MRKSSTHVARLPRLPAALAALMLCAPSTALAGDAKDATVPKGPAGHADQVKKSVDKGLRWLRSQQFEDGSYGRYPALTAMALLSFANSHRKYRESDGPFVANAVKYLLAQQKADGGIYAKDLPTYNTAMALLALAALENPKHADAIRKAQRFLVGKQSVEANGYQKDDKFYGGIGYGGDERPDLSNLQLALEALKTSGFPANDPVWKKAETFINRCQNRSESNDQKWAGNDGGFVYAPGQSPFGGTKSYGAMTFSGLKSLIFLNAKKDDPRVQAAVKWVGQNYSVDEHPGAGQVSLFYYFHTMSKALAAYGEQHVVDKKGVKHDWYADLSSKLMGMQRDDGSWVNSEPKYWESNPLLATSWALIALEAGQK